jgi:acyl-CoA thioesterase
MPLPIFQPTQQSSPFLHSLGVRFLSMADGRAVLELNLTHAHMNSWELTHGGVVMSLLDVVMAMAGRTLTPDLKGVVTIEMKTTFMQPAGVAGERLEARGLALNRSTTMCFCEGELWNGDRLVAKASGTFKYLKRVRSADALKAINSSVACDNDREDGASKDE